MMHNINSIFKQFLSNGVRMVNRLKNSVILEAA